MTVDKRRLDRDEIGPFFDGLAAVRGRWRKRDAYYHRLVADEISRIIPPGASVCEIGCGDGWLLATLAPSYGLGIDLSPEMIRIARESHEGLSFVCADAAGFETDRTFDYVVISDSLAHMYDIVSVLERVRGLCHSRTKIIITSYNELWEPLLRLAELTGRKMPEEVQNWLSAGDITNLLAIAGFDVVTRTGRILLPMRIALLSPLVNALIANLPGLNRLCLTKIIVARPRPADDGKEKSVSIVVPVRNEKGNLAAILRRLPRFTARMELIFVEGRSTDGSYEELLRLKDSPDALGLAVSVLKQDGRGKADAVRKGFAAATGEILMILDADMTVAPEDLPKFHRLVAHGTCDFVNGVRLVYPMQDESMRFLNFLGNKLFTLLVSFVMGQRVKDTLCGTKALRRDDYLTIARDEHGFARVDPFGDFELLFGAALHGLLIADLPIRYGRRTYGATNIRRFRDGLKLLRLTFAGARRLRFR